MRIDQRRAANSSGRPAETAIRNRVGAVSQDHGPGAETAPLGRTTGRVEGRDGSRRPGFELNGVSLVRDDRQVLSEIDLELGEGRIGIIGLNGSGKSSLIRLLNGLLRPTTGTVTWKGLSTDGQAKQIRRCVGFVFQNPNNQIVMPIVADDLAFGLRSLRLPKAETAQRVRAGLERLGIGALADRESHSLSGGEKQLLALAAVLVMEPQVIIFDEPTTMLDLKNKRSLMRIVDDLPQQVIMVTHDLDSITHFDRVLLIEGTRIAADGPPASVIEQYRELCR